MDGVGRYGWWTRLVEVVWWMWSVDVVGGCGRWMWLIDVVVGCGWWLWLVEVGGGCG